MAGADPEHARSGFAPPHVVYLPPDAAVGRFPVIYLLHGLPGSPYSYVDGLDLAAVADRMISTGQVTPFVAVMPPAGLTPRFHGEWIGVWERYLVSDVVPWVEEHLPVAGGRAASVVGGFSAGGYGAVDMGLRNPSLFGTVESWSGYFRPIRDGSLAHADAAELAAHDPTRLVAQRAGELRRLGTRFFLSAGSTRDRATAAATRAFATLLARERLPRGLWVGPGGHDGRFWRSQLPAALRYAFSYRQTRS